MSSCRTEPYEKLVLKLDTARDGKTATIKQGEALYIKSISSGATLTVKIDKEGADELDLNESGGFRYIKIRFEQLFFTHDAQADLEVEFWILRKGTAFDIIERDVNVVKVKGVALTDPTIEASLPVSIENPAIAYEEADDVFKVHQYVDDAEIDPRTITSQPSTLFLHDRATYKTAIFDASASGDIVALVSTKVIKVHAITIQAQGTVTVNILDDTAGNSLDEWKLEDREGAVMPFIPYPAYWFKSAVSKCLYASLSASVTTVIKVVYTDADAT